MSHQPLATLSAFGLAAALLGAAALPAAAQDAGGAQVQFGKAEPFGRHLVDGEGRSLYLLKSDVKSSADDQEPVSTCYDACAEQWPPFTSEADPTVGSQAAGSQAAGSLLSTTERTDGTRQVTFNGWPLYYYSGDQGAGDTKGQDVHDEWGEWYLVSPAGLPVEGEG